MNARLLRGEAVALVALLSLAPTCTLPSVEHVFDDGTFTLTYWQVDQQRVGRTELDVRFAGRLESKLSVDADTVRATASSADPATAVVESLLVFGPVAAGGSVDSDDTFTIRQDRTVPFDPTDLSFGFDSSAPPTPFGFAGTVGAPGGLVDGALGDLRLDFPTGALAVDTPISIVPLDSGEPGLLGSPELLPDGESFGAPVALAFSYEDTDLSQDLDENDLTIFRVEDDDSLTPLASTVDPVANTVTAGLDGFSRYQLSYSAPCGDPRDFDLCFGALSAIPAAGPGPLDPAFGTGGVRVIDTGSFLDEATDVVLQPDGRILLGGHDNHMTVWRLLEDGSDDPSFGGGGGRARVVVQVQSFGNDLELAPDGRILLAGSSNSPPPDTTDVDPVVLRFDAFGELDTGFANGGVLLETDENSFFNVAVGLYPDGRILTMGNGSFYQYLENGTPDPGFGTDGVLDRTFGTGLFLQVRGLAGFRFTSGGRVEAYDSRGGDNRRGGIFGKPPRQVGALVGNTILGIQAATQTTNEGVFLTRFSGSSLLETDDRLRGVREGVEMADATIDPTTQGGRLNQSVYVAVGTVDGPNDRDLWIARFGARAGGGSTLLDLGGDEEAAAVAMDDQGRIVVVGTTRPAGQTFPLDIVVARFQAASDPQ